MIDERALFTRLQRGDQQAWGELYAAHRRTLLAIVRRVGVPVDAQDDVLQEALLKAFRAIARLDVADQPLHWLNTLVANAARDYLRAQRRHAAVPLAPLVEREDALPEAYNRRLCDRRPAPEERALLAEQLAQALAALPRRERRALLLQAQGYSEGEIAQAEGTTRAAVKQRLFRGRHLVRERAV